MPATDPVAANADLVTALVEDAVGAAEEVEEDLAADIDPTTEDGGAVSEDGTAEAPEQETEPEGTVPAPATDSPSTGALTADTTADSGDTAGGSTATAGESEAGTPTTSSPAAATTPSTEAGRNAVNVNVSVRIGSAGDNGAVSQGNATVAPSPLSSTAPLAASDTTAPSTGGQSTSTSEPWYWEWDCRDLPSLVAVSPDDSAGISLPSSWTWIWNCEGNPDQYHRETDQQYQQSNTNISIRISSPGDDGPVTQTNIVISAGVEGSGALPTVGLPAIELPIITLPAPALSLPTITLPTTIFGPTTPSVAVPAIVVGVPVAIPTPFLDVEATVEWALEVVGVEPATVARPLSTAPFEAGGLPPSLITADEDAVGAGGLGRPSFGALEAPIDVVTIRSDSSPTGGRADVRHEPQEAKTAPRWKPSRVSSDTKAPPSGTSASAAGAGGSSSGGLPLFLALPFIAAALDLARRVALERATWPSGHRRRVPDTPG